MINPGDEITLNDGRKVIADKHPKQNCPLCEGNCDLFLDLPNCASVPCNRASNAYGMHLIYKFKSIQK